MTPLSAQMKSILKKTALLIPPIRNLYLDRAQLVAEKLALTRIVEQLEPRFWARAGLTHRHRNWVGNEHRCATRAYAIVGSAGRTATNWIAAAFNLHARVFFSHGPDLEPRKHSRPQDGLKDFLRISQQMASFDFADFDKYFDLLESRGEFTVYGNVHGLIPLDDDRMGRTFRRPYYTCAVVRHPILRIRSFISRWRYESHVSELRRGEYSPDHYRHQNQELISELSKAYGITDLDEVGTLFIKALRLTMDTDNYYLDSGIPLFQMERLVSDVDYFLGLFYEATGGLVEAGDDFLIALKELRPIEQRNNSITAKSVYSSWAPWQQRYFRDALVETDLLDAYHALGYNLRPIFARRSTLPARSASPSTKVHQLTRALLSSVRRVAFLGGIVAR